ncbi:MAG TPA: hypothetical protein VM620_03900 [Hyphomicrobium sp.]|nr:hypothetical protein [Hyphomicrobium sp.]
MTNKNVSKVILGGTNDMGLGSKTLAEGITSQVNIVPVTKEGQPLSVAELNRLRIGNGLGQHPNSNYGVPETKTKAKPSKKKAAR